MTAICGGGPSQSKPGFNQTVIITSAAVEGALTILGLEVLAAVLAPFIAGETYDLTTFCTVDPPPDPGLTAQDLLDVTNFVDPTVSLPALNKVRNWFKSWYWYQVCECTSVSTPNPSAPSNPGGVSTNPALPVGSTPSACWTSQVAIDTTGGFNFMDMSRLLWPSNHPTDTTPTNNQRSVVDAIPTQIVWEAKCNGFGANPITGAQLTIRFLNSGGAEISRATTGNTPMADAKITATPPAGTATIEFDDAYTNVDSLAPSTGNATESLTMYCFGQTPISPVSPCCPPDPSIELKLNQLLGLVTSIYQGLPLPIISYAEGASHSVAGNGSFLIDASTIAVRVTITAISPQTGFAVGDPIAYFNAGWITPIAAEAPLAGYPIRYSPQVIPLPDIAEQVGYSLPPGAAITIVELSRGP